MFSIHACAHHCRSYAGHPFSYHLACQKSIETLGGTYAAYVHEECCIPSLPPRWKYWFPSLTGKKKFQERMRSLFVEATGDKRLFFIETFGRRDLRAFAVQALLHHRPQDHVWVLFRDDHIWKRARDRFEVRLWMWLLNLRFGNRFQLLSDSRLISDFLGCKLRRSFTTLPIPLLDLPKQPFKQLKTFRLLFVGEPRKEKGRQEVLSLLSTQDPAASCIELTLSEQLREAISSTSLILHYHARSLDQQHYLELLNRCDVLLLPYCSHRYQRRTSGIFVEAIWMGKIPLVAEGSWLAHELRRHQLEMLIVDFTSPLFFTHLIRLSQHPQLYEALNAMQTEYHHFHNLHSLSAHFQNLLYPNSSSL